MPKREEVSVKKTKQTHPKIRPLTREEVKRLKPRKAREAPPRDSVLTGKRRLYVASPAGRRFDPVASAARVGKRRGSDIWRVDVQLPPQSRETHLPLEMEKIPIARLRRETRRRVELGGFCPPWADVTYRLVGKKRPRERAMFAKGKRVRPLYVFDDRRRLVTNGSYPWWSIGKVTSNRGTGTGTLVGSKIVLTAGHMVPWDSADPWMKFAPAWNIPAVSFGEWDCVRAHGVSVGNPPSGSDEAANDVAIVQLETNLGDTLGFWGWNRYHDDWDDVGYWTSVGYPEDWPDQPVFEDADTVEDADSEGDGLLLETEASLAHGNSGGPFCAWFSTPNGPDPRVIGVVSSQGNLDVFPQDHDNFLAAGKIASDLIKWGRVNLM